MTRVDWIALAIVGVGALAGLRRGLVAGLLSAGGFVAGALLGGRIARQVLEGGSYSAYAPVVALAGALLLAAVLQGVGSMIGSMARRSLVAIPPLKALDSMGGALLGATLGLALVWVLGAVALQLPGQRALRLEAQRSDVLRRLNSLVPPGRLLQALHRVDPFPAITGPSVPSEPVDPSVLGGAAVRRAAPSVVRILGTACGLGISGSGWVARRGVVVTAAHVVAGQDDTIVEPPGSSERYRAHAIAFDPHNDVAVLSVPGLRARPLRLAPPRRGAAVAIVGYPENGPLVLDPRPDRPDLDCPDAGRLRPRAGYALDHLAEGPRPSR